MFGASSIRRALGTFLKNPTVNLMTIGTIAAALVVAGLYLALLQGMEGLSVGWGKNATLSLYLDENLKSDQWQQVHLHVEERVRKNSHGLPIDAVQLQTPNTLLERFKARGPKEEALVAGIDAEIFPATIEITLGSGFASLDAIASLAGFLEKMPQIQSVDYGQEEFQELAALLKLLRMVGAGIGLLLAGAIAFIIGNTIRLAVYARRDEIAILELVGATASFIRTPFLVEGVLWGLGGGLLASALLYLAHLVVAPSLNQRLSAFLGEFELLLFSAPLSLLLILAGMMIGLLGAATALRRFMESSLSA